MKKRLLQSSLILGALLLFSEQYATAGTPFSDKFNAARKVTRTEKKKGYSDARVAEESLSLPTIETIYNWDNSTNDWMSSGVFNKITYDALGNKVAIVTVNAEGDSVSKQLFKYNERGDELERFAYYRSSNDYGWILSYASRYEPTYNVKGNLTEEKRYTWNNSSNNWTLENAYKYLYAYDGSGRMTQEVAQVYNIENAVYVNSYKDDYTYTGSSTTFSGIKSYTYSGTGWIISGIGTDVVWRNFEENDLASYVYIYFEEEYEYRETYNSTSSGNGESIVEIYYNDDWYVVNNRIETTDLAGNSVVLRQSYDYEAGEWVNVERNSEFVDDEGNDAGYMNEQWNGTEWEVMNSNIYTRTYNSNSELLEEIYESFSSEGTYKSKSVFSDHEQVGVITAVQNQYMETSILAYPNPTHDILYLDNGLREQVNLSIYTLGNELVLNTRIMGGKGSVSLENLNPGVYLLKTESVSGKVSTKKIVKD